MTALAPIRYLSVCSGIDAATVAWSPLGWKPVAFSEIEPFPRDVLAHRHGAIDARRSGATRRGVPLWGDFTTMRPRNFRRLGIDPAIDLLVGGTPCQNFSVAGLRAGLRGARGNLTLEFARLARRFRPTWMVWENVPGVFSLNQGRDFGAIIACFAGYPEGSTFEPPKDGWCNFGVVPPADPDSYGLAWIVLDAQYFGVPQRRRRVFVVGYLGDWRPAVAVLLERESLCGNPPPSRDARAGVAALTAHGVGTCGADDNQAQAGHLIPETCATLDASYGRLQGCSNQDSNHGYSHLVPQVFGGNNTTGPIDVAPALNAHGGGSRRMDFESEAFVATTLRARDLGRGVDSDCTDTLVAHTLRAEGFDASEDGQIAVAIQEVGKRTGTSTTDPRAGIGIGDVGDPMFTLQAGAQHGVASGSAVRRLTPRECDRLQGFPDDFPRIPMTKTRATSKPRDKWIRSRGTLVRGPGGTVTTALWRRIDNDEVAYLAGMGHEVAKRSNGHWYTTAAADGPCYKAEGNGMAAPVMAWIGRRIEMVRGILAEQRNMEAAE